MFRRRSAPKSLELRSCLLIGNRGWDRNGRSRPRHNTMRVRRRSVRKITTNSPNPWQMGCFVDLARYSKKLKEYGKRKTAPQGGEYAASSEKDKKTDRKHHTKINYESESKARRNPGGRRGNLLRKPNRLPSKSVRISIPRGICAFSAGKESDLFSKNERASETVCGETISLLR